jgi:hypothetical protein
VASPKPPKSPSQFDADLARLADAFRDNDPAVFYTLLMNSKVLYTVTQTENLWARVGEEGEVQSVVYLHFLKGWDRIRGHALASGGPVAGYLVEVIRNAVRDALRKQERRQKRERSLVRGLEGERGNEAEAVEDDSGSVLDSVIAAEEHQRLMAAESDPEQAKFGAVYKLKMMMRCSIDQLDRYALTAAEAAWTPSEPDYPHPRPAGRVAAWIGRLRRRDEMGKRFKPTSRKLVRMLGMVRRNAVEQVLKDKANVFDQWFRRAKVKLAARLKE